MAVTFAVRQGLAHSVMQSWDRAASVPSAPPRPVAADLPRPASAAPFGLPLPIGAPAGPLMFAGAYRSLPALPADAWILGYMVDTIGYCIHVVGYL